MRSNAKFPLVRAALLPALILGASLTVASVSQAQCSRGGGRGAPTATTSTPMTSALTPATTISFEQAAYNRSSTPSVQQLMAQQQMYAMMQQQAAYQQQLQQMWVAKQQREYQKRQRRLAAARSRRLQKEQQREQERQERIAALQSSSQTS